VHMKVFFSYEWNIPGIFHLAHPHPVAKIC